MIPLLGLITSTALLFGATRTGLFEKGEQSQSEPSTEKPHMATCAVCSERILIPQQGTVLDGVPVCGRCQGARQTAQDEDADAGYLFA